MGKIKAFFRNKCVGFTLASILYILWFVLWTGNWWLLLGEIVIFDLYITRYFYKYVWRHNAEMCKKSKSYKAVYEWVNAIIFATVVASLVHIFFFQMYVIPSSSMEKSLLVGDYLYVSKVAYGPQMPNTPVAFPFVHHTMPFSKTKKSFSESVKWPYHRLKGLGRIERNDVVVFNFPAGDTVLLERQDVSYYDVLRQYQQTFGHQAGRERLMQEYTVITRPVDKRENYIKRCIGLPVLTSGGDAPGMNAAIRAVTRTAIYNGYSVKGIMRGYKGLVDNEIVDLQSDSVSNIIQQGGTMLKTARSQEFMTPEGRRRAYENMKRSGIDALVVIGGDGSLKGACIFAQEFDVPIVGLPGTIDNDLGGTDATIGYDTALNTIVEAVDKLRDTASSHERLFFVEVMGHTAGYLALNGAIASGAEAAIIPEMDTEVDQLGELINQGFRKSKNSAIVLVAENPATGGAMGLAERVKQEFPQYDARVTILGHIQRGGSPSAIDRIMASRMGEASIEALMEGQRNVMIGMSNGQIVYVPFSRAVSHDRTIDRGAVDLVRILSI